MHTEGLKYLSEEETVRHTAIWRENCLHRKKVEEKNFDSCTTKHLRHIRTLHSAPEAFGIFSAITFRSIPRRRFILREWIPIMSIRDVSVGCGNSILRSIRPGRRRAGSKISMRFVAMTTWGEAWHKRVIHGIKEDDETRESGATASRRRS